MGHDSACAALIYQHATTGADHQIADALASRITDAHSARIATPDEAASDPGPGR